MTDALHTLPLRTIAERLRSGEVTASALLTFYEDRIARLNPLLNAIVTTNPGAAAAARAADERLQAGTPLGPLDGIPVAIKDNLVVKELRATWGTRLYENFVPDWDELPVARLRAGGAVIVGKTNVPAFTLEGYTDNAVFGPTGNPWNVALTPGGSSGGAVAAVAAGLVPLAIATDGGGSIRRPAAHTGLVGLKPGLGRVARANGFAQILHDLETVGPIARRVDDARLAMEVIAGPDRRDPRSRFYLEFGAAPNHPKAPLTILFVERFGDHPVDPAIQNSVAVAAERLAALGHTIRKGALPLDVETIAARWPAIGKAGLAMLAASEVHFFENAEEKYAALAREGAALPGGAVFAILEEITVFRSATSALFSEVDLILLPATAAQPWPVREAYPQIIDGRKVGPRGHAVFTGWVNASGHPAIALPSDPDASGMPIGFQLVADLGREELLLAVAEAYETQTWFPERWPALAAV